MDANTIVIGNTATKIDNQSWKWTVFVNHTTKDIKDITMYLHPTFNPNIIRLEKNKNGNFQSESFTGWGTFEIRVEIQWNDGNVSQFKHLLVFGEGGGVSTFTRGLWNKEIQITNTPSDPEDVDMKEIKTDSLARKDVQEKLSKTDFLEHSSTSFWHGRLFTENLTTPKVTWKSQLTPRNDHDAPHWLTASEYCDIPDVLETKLKYLAELLKISQRTVIYTGAGISRAAGIGQAARGAGKDGGKGLNASPTLTHYALGALAKSGYIHNWIQQNHDGLPQKAGFPQESINEIHGSWYDPSNPVVLYSGTLKKEQYPWMVKEAKNADLVLVLGTSLGGLNADQVAIRTAERSRNDQNYHGGGALGTVMINLQQTQHDGKSTIRIFGNSDDVLAKLLKMLEIPTPILKPSTFDNDPKVLVPYDATGKRSNKVKMWLDLRNGASIKLTSGHNCQGAGQPAYLHIGADKPSNHNKKVMKNGPGNGIVVKRNNNIVGIELSIEGQSMVLGQWWIDAAIRGGPKTLPVVNINPEMVNI